MIVATFLKVWILYIMSTTSTGKPLLTGKHSPAIERVVAQVNGYVNRYCCRDLQNPLSMNFLPAARASIYPAKKLIWRF